MPNKEIADEIQRIKDEYPNADADKLRALGSIIGQAAHERVYLKRLNEQALASGLVLIHPQNPMKQRVLPVSSEIVKHSASLAHLTEILIKHLAAESDEDDGLGDYE